MREQDTPHLAAYAQPFDRRLLDLCDELTLNLLGVFVGNDAPVDAELDVVWHDVGVDAALDEADDQRRAVNALDLGFHRPIAAPQAVEVGLYAVGRLHCVIAGIRASGVRRLADNLDLEVKRAIVGGGDAVGKAGRYGVIGLGNALFEQPLRADGTACLLVVGKVQFHRAFELCAAGLQGREREGVGGEIGLGHRHAAAVHHAVADFCAIRIGGPAQPRRDHVAVGVAGHGRTVVAETLAHHQVGARHHAVGLDQGIGHGMLLHLEAHGLEQRGGAHRMRRAVTGRVVRGHPHQFGQKTRFLLAPCGQQFADFPACFDCHVRRAF